MHFGSQDEEQTMKRYIVSLLVQQAQSDQQFEPIEKKYLAYAGNALGMSQQEIEQIRQQPGDFDIPPPASEQNRMTILYYLLFMMRADGVVMKEEEEFCHHIGFRLGIRRDLISDMINLMKECLRQEIPPNAMLERIKPYLN